MFVIRNCVNIYVDLLNYSEIVIVAISIVVTILSIIRFLGLLWVQCFSFSEIFHTFGIWILGPFVRFFGPPVDDVAHVNLVIVEGCVLHAVLGDQRRFHCLLKGLTPNKIIFSMGIKLQM